MAVIVVGVDGSRGAAAALAATCRLAADAGHEVVAVHVAHLPAIVTATPGALAAGAAATANDEIADHCHLDCELALAGTGIVWAFEVRHGHRPLARLLLGSVSDRLVHHANRPVLVVPPVPP